MVLDGEIVQSESGGGHWGGGMFIDALDMVRLGYLTLVQPGYGFMKPAAALAPGRFPPRNGDCIASAPRARWVHKTIFGRLQ